MSLRVKPQSDEQKLHIRHIETDEFPTQNKVLYRNKNARKGCWTVAGSGILIHTITNERLVRGGYHDISEAYKFNNYL